MGTSVHALLLLGAASACVTNPAKHPSPTNVELAYDDASEDSPWRRGDEQLDEQDFYELAGDKPAVEEIEDHRASGVRKQTIGTVMMGIGAAVLAGTAYAYLQRETLFEDGEMPSWLLYGGAFTTVLVGGGGWQIRKGGAEAVLEKPILSKGRAEEALMLARYGARTVGPGIVKAIEWDAPATYCVAGGGEIGAFVLRDRGGRDITELGKEWVTVHADPEEAYLVGSITGTSIDALDRAVTITLAVRDSDVKKVATIAPTFECHERIDLSAPSGSNGDKGSKGAKGEAVDGGDGADGGDGGDGEDGPLVTVEAAHVTYRGKRLLAVAVEAGNRKKLMIVDAEKGSVSIDARGGRGGSGGSGGDGGNLDTFRLRETGCRHVTSGNGGNGGGGGKGGRGGQVTIRGPKEAIHAVTFDVDGGAPGVGGSPGSHGDTGVGCIGKSGERGKSGPDGARGASGKGTRDVTDASDLPMLRELLAGSEVVLEGEAPAKKPKKR
ncbi:MAG: hypothetical protein AB7T06_35250 [Kofleriaceae bacterium]